MSELKPCPFCGEQVFTPLVSSLDDGYTRCISCGAKMQRSRWQARPIEDALRKRIAELKGFIGQLIEAGDAISNAHSMWVAEEDKWDALVKDWEEREE